MATPADRVTDTSEGEIDGFVEAIVDDHLVGWAWRPSAPQTRVRVQIAVDEQPCAELVADHPSAPLAEEGVGDGRYSFWVRLPDGVLDGGNHELLVLADGQPLRPRRLSYQASLGTSFVVVTSFSAHRPAPAFSARVGGSAPIGEARARGTRIDGLLEGVVGDQLVGWAWCPDAASARVEIEVLLDGQTIGEAVARWQREDLRQAGIGDGAHGFSCRLPEHAGVGRQQLIEVRAGAARIPLQAARGYGSAAPASSRILRPARYTRVPATRPMSPETALVGDEGWLFPLYDAQATALSALQIQIAAERYEDICRTLSEMDIPYLLAIAPHKQDVYPQLAAGARSAHDRFVRLLRAELRDSQWPEPFDLADPLRDARQHGDLYPRTDTRLNARGSFFATRAVIKEIAKRVPTARPLTFDVAWTVRVEGFRGDLIGLPRAAPGGEGVDAADLPETTVEADASNLRSLQMPAPDHLVLPGHPAPRLFEIHREHELPRLALMGMAMVDQLLPWFPEHSARTLVFCGHEPPLEPLELEAPEALVHVVTAIELLSQLRYAHP